MRYVKTQPSEYLPSEGQVKAICLKDFKKFIKYLWLRKNFESRRLTRYLWRGYKVVSSNIEISS
jgi:hypothetical protein